MCGLLYTELKNKKNRIKKQELIRKKQYSSLFKYQKKNSIKYSSINIQKIELKVHVENTDHIHLKIVIYVLDKIE